MPLIYPLVAQLKAKQGDLHGDTTQAIRPIHSAFSVRVVEFRYSSQFMKHLCQSNVEIAARDTRQAYSCILPKNVNFGPLNLRLHPPPILVFTAFLQVLRKGVL